MEKAKHKIISEYRPKAYYQNTRKIAVLMLAVLPCLAFLFGFYDLVQNNTPYSEIAIFAVAALIYAIIAWRVYYLGFADRIVITPEGIAVEGWHSAFADWDTLSHFETQIISGRNRRRVYGIHTTKPVMNPKSRGHFNYDFTDNFIPISHIVKLNQRIKWLQARREPALDNFVKSPLGQDLLRYAPQLFEGEKLSDDEIKNQEDANNELVQFEQQQNTQSKFQ